MLDVAATFRTVVCGQLDATGKACPDMVSHLASFLQQCLSLLLLAKKISLFIPLLCSICSEIAAASSSWSCLRRDAYQQRLGQLITSFFNCRMG